MGTEVRGGHEASRYAPFTLLADCSCLPALFLFFSVVSFASLKQLCCPSSSNQLNFILQLIAEAGREGETTHKGDSDRINTILSARRCPCIFLSLSFSGAIDNVVFANRTYAHRVA